LNQFGVTQEEGMLLAREYMEKAMTNPTSLAHYLASEMNLHRYQWQERNGGHKICYPVFRNPEGKLEKQNEYLYITDLKIFPFSTLD